MGIWDWGLLHQMVLHPSLVVSCKNLGTNFNI